MEAWRHGGRHSIRSHYHDESGILRSLEKGIFIDFKACRGRRGLIRAAPLDGQRHMSFYDAYQGVPLRLGGEAISLQILLVHLNAGEVCQNYLQGHAVFESDVVKCTSMGEFWAKMY